MAILLELRDAIHEGDGERIFRCWKFMLLYFRHGNRYKYALEAFYFIANIVAIVSPRMRHQLLWSRLVNTRGGAGNNIPSDLFMEHCIRNLKECLSSIGANLTEETIVNESKVLDGMQMISQNFESATNLHRNSIHHTRKSLSTDMKLIVNQLVHESNVFNYIPGRKHRSFPHIIPNVTWNINAEALFNWIISNRKKLSDKIKFQKLFH